MARTKTKVTVAICIHLCAAIALLSSGAFSCKKKPAVPRIPKVMVFSKTSGYRHESIPAGQQMFTSMSNSWNIQLSFSEDTAKFNTDSLAAYSFIVLLNSTGELFSAAQRNALKQYVESGGAVLGIHAAADAEYSWDWYPRMLGGLFSSHPAIQPATCKVVMPGHWSALGLPQQWQRTDEWYNFSALQPDNQVVITIDEATYQGGSHGAIHPISWYRTANKGKVFYTAMGHTVESYSDSLFIRHIGGAIKWLLQ